MSTRPGGITHPSIDDLLKDTESKYSLVIYAARRARQITGYHSQVGDYLLEYVGPLVETHPQEKHLSIALREIHAGMLMERQGDAVAQGDEAQAPADGVSEPEGGVTFVPVDTTETVGPDAG
jgi:DNA-directed RNA polymerase subunit omega